MKVNTELWAAWRRSQVISDLLDVVRSTMVPAMQMPAAPCCSRAVKRTRSPST